jgi:hypothetical protein
VAGQWTGTSLDGWDAKAAAGETLVVLYDEALHGPQGAFREAAGKFKALYADGNDLVLEKR